MSLIEKAPNFFRRIVGFPENGEGTQFPQLIVQNRIAHKVLGEALFSGDAWKYEVLVDTKSSSEFLPVINLLLPLLPEEDRTWNQEQNFAPLMENRMKSGMKASKYLSRVSKSEKIGGLVPVLAERNDEFWMNLYKVLPKLPEEWREDCFELLSHFDVVIQNFYSEVASNTKITLGISTDLFDFLEVCNSPNFRSCYTTGGVNEAAPFHYAVSNNTAIIYTRNEKGVLGRSWVIFPENLDSFYVMKSYGFISGTCLLKMASYVCEKLGGEWGFYRTYNDYRPNTGYSFPGMWDDPCEYVFSKHAFDGKLYAPENYQFNEAGCIVCGAPTYEGKFVCMEHYREYTTDCVSCGQKYYDMSVPHQNVCQTCMSGLKVCPVCGTYFDERQGQCPKCRWASKCHLCGKTSEVPLYKIGNLQLCRECKEALLQGVCDVCGEYESTYPLSGWALCKSCYVKVDKGTPLKPKKDKDQVLRDALNCVICDVHTERERRRKQNDQ